MASSAAFELKGGTLPLMCLYLKATDLERLQTELGVHLARAAAFFADAPVVVDFGRLPTAGDGLALAALVELLRAARLRPVGVRNGCEPVQQEALAAGLAVFPPAAVEMPGAAAAGGQAAASLAATAGAQPARLIRRHVRSGQRIVAPGGDLVVLGSVSPGAEILAGGDIHVYGALRGRALAGAEGYTGARIFCLDFNPDLVAVAGEYLVNEELDTALLGKAVSVSLEDERLRLEPIVS